MKRTRRPAAFRPSHFKWDSIDITNSLIGALHNVGNRTRKDNTSQDVRSQLIPPAQKKQAFSC